LHLVKAHRDANSGPIEEGANMKNLTTKMTIAAAAFMAVAGVASAQTLEAKIPFEFRANGKVLPAGTYRVEMSRAPILVIESKEPGQGVLAVAFGSDDPKKEWVSAGQGVLLFQCGVGPCALRDIWAGEGGRPVYRIRVPRVGKGEPQSVAEIVMHPVKGD